MVQKHMTHAFKDMTHMRVTKHQQLDPPTQLLRKTCPCRSASLFVRAHTDYLRSACQSAPTPFILNTRSCFTSHDKQIVIIGALGGLFPCSFSYAAPDAMNLPVNAESRTEFDGHFHSRPCWKLKFHETFENLMERQVAIKTLKTPSRENTKR